MPQPAEAVQLARPVRARAARWRTASGRRDGHAAGEAEAAGGDLVGEARILRAQVGIGGGAPSTPSGARRAPHDEGADAERDEAKRRQHA